MMKCISSSVCGPKSCFFLLEHDALSDFLWIVDTWFLKSLCALYTVLFTDEVYVAKYVLV